MIKAVYPGSFDPVTNGHIDIIQRGAKIYDEVIVLVAENISKTPLFSLEERLDMLRHSLKDIPNVKIDHFSGLLVDYLKKIDVKIIIRGLRAVSDFEYEFQQALTNKKLYPECETVFLVSDLKYTFLSSSMVKEIAKFGGCIKGLVPDYVAEKLYEKFKVK
ncbi:MULTISPECIES: pantetheine-phosphate adenylyltransferase [Dictyoglomus]|jgi:pantetheine-phosphate adenylyltransferase|uniref:Phosphopantetheine adenylyltransferase n=1 Tax=Dictyoglomus turgidum (strain DSM 6724 / Z-1310) TaxID=515635 RepID=COAD_DICTD|nr:MULTISPECIES: pantetheine-phosphate adenylyltransferase [Dictyoglomus]B8E2S1.1 RecName: Full=Phosphopantetheine adenylyltransferase; AltName: Full=Dephospho-CoA pyrophosphorylase; AltName: Full=Pantetheine-phosphate adenylyltransferase; Short=PPAT [Dictyoglomus turgidum DSM 6724]ACK42421.1 pantetheine-phosphate adenylyltransferase [Dictyoglomus turgidum DSM 6724]PNV80704.1 MAG: phosphopantetheine adenylyltransferase [Dictyoglomus turgidum]HBU32123.1 phosphopantetheine adenylyltransferase [Di